MPVVDFIFSSDCPNVNPARAALSKAFALAQLPPQWNEWVTDQADCPQAYLAFGSPTILVNGLEIADSPQAKGSSCRVYLGAAGKLCGTPSAELIADSLRRAERSLELGALRQIPHPV